jgi:hypothetical protein
MTTLPYSRLYVLLTPRSGLVSQVEEEDLEALLPLVPGDARVAVGADGYFTDHDGNKG